MRSSGGGGGRPADIKSNNTHLTAWQVGKNVLMMFLASKDRKRISLIESNDCIPVHVSSMNGWTHVPFQGQLFVQENVMTCAE